jgi:hypothetical protein
MTTLNVKNRQSLELEQLSLVLESKTKINPLTKQTEMTPERIKLAMNRNLRKCYRCFDYVL